VSNLKKARGADPPEPRAFFFCAPAPGRVFIALGRRRRV